MSDLENIMKNVMYGGIGAAATLVEKTGEIARSLVEKGQETVRNNQDTVDQIKDKAEDLKRRVKEFCERFMNDDVIDTSCLTPEQRQALRRQLDEQDELDRQAAQACQYDEPAAGETPNEAPAEQAGPSDDDVPVFEPENPAE